MFVLVYNEIKEVMKMLALLLPVIAYGLYLYLPTINILSDFYVGIVLGLYVVLLYKNTNRRKIALIHCVASILLLFMDLPALWIFTFTGLSIAMTRHDQIDPLCPLPKTRMIIMSCLLLIPFLFIKLNLPAIVIEITNGLLMGFYVWMKERLNNSNREIVTNLTFSLGLGLSFLFKQLTYIFVPWIIFVKIIQIFKVKFI